jgi:hypothetical protein
VINCIRLRTSFHVHSGRAANILKWQIRHPRKQPRHLDSRCRFSTQIGWLVENAILVELEPPTVLVDELDTDIVGYFGFVLPKCLIGSN